MDHKDKHDKKKEERGTKRDGEGRSRKSDKVWSSSSSSEEDETYQNDSDDDKKADQEAREGFCAEGG